MNSRRRKVGLSGFRPVLDADSILKITLLCGNAFDEPVSFWELDPETGKKTSLQIHFTQCSKRVLNAYNADEKIRSVINLPKINVDDRFLALLLEVDGHDAHYLKTGIVFDSQGVISSILRSWTRHKVPLSGRDERPALLYDRDSETADISANRESALREIARLVKATGGNLERLPPEDELNACGAGRGSLRVVIPSRGRGPQGR